MKEAQVSLLAVIFALIEEDDVNLRFDYKYHQMALMLLRKFHEEATTPVYDKILKRYLKSIKCTNFMTSPTEPIYCYELCARASTSLVAEAIEQFCRLGFDDFASSLARDHQDGVLTIDEVEMLVQHYLGGALYSSSEEGQLLKLAASTGNQTFYNEKKKAIDKRQQDYHHSGA